MKPGLRLVVIIWLLEIIGSLIGFLGNFNLLVSFAYIDNSKSAMFSHVYAPTWMALGHSDALEGEHDHAILKYSTALKSNPG